MEIPGWCSLMHRITGFGAAVGLGSGAIGMALTPVTFTQIVQFIDELAIHPHVMTTLRTLIALPLIYHALNGVRHLVWDYGKGFVLKEVYKSGYVVIALSFILAILVGQM